MNVDRRALARGVLVFTMFTAIAAVFLYPLFAHFGSRIALDAGDPTLNASVLWWNATTLPLTDAWWNQPWFHPAFGVVAFTENLLGISPIATPAYWVTRNPIAMYNVAFFASWPLSAFTMYLLVRRLTSRTDAAILAGLAFAFTPYRSTVIMGHVQMLSVYWLPLALTAAHAYLKDHRRRWLLIFGASWVLQSLSNGYFMMFGAVLIGLWLVYFGTSMQSWRGALNLLVCWVISSLALVPVFVGYHRLHEYYGLTRTMAEAIGFSAHPDYWFSVSEFSRFWRGVLPPGRDPMFPGVTVVVLVLIAVIAALLRASPAGSRLRRRALIQTSLVVITLCGFGALLAFLVNGPITVGGAESVWFRMRDPSRAFWVLALSAGALAWLSPVRNVIAERRPLIFYATATLVMALLACGPILSTHNRVVLDPAPYRWLMVLPGFDGLRVPLRFWMMGVLCLSVAAGLGYAAISRAASRMRWLIFVAASAGILIDGWPTALTTGKAPAVWVEMSGADKNLPLLELPLGPRWDNAATFRTTAHGRRVMNGVSGHEPRHYDALKAGLAARDPEMLPAIASLGAYEISIERVNDPDGGWKQYALGAPGAAIVAEDDFRTIVRVPSAMRTEPILGPRLPIASISASRGDPMLVIDHRTDTGWSDFPQEGTQFLLADLGSVQTIGGISVALGKQAAEFPRGIAIDVSTDGKSYAEIVQSGGAAPTFLSALRNPREVWLRFAVPPREARFVRLRQTAWVRERWVVQEFEINSPAARHP